MPSGDAAERSPNSPDRPSIDPMQKTRNRRPNSRWPSAIRAGWRWVLTLGLQWPAQARQARKSPLSLSTYFLSSRQKVSRTCTPKKMQKAGVDHPL